MHNLVVLAVAVVAVLTITGTNGQETTAANSGSSSTASTAQQILSFAEMSVNGTPVWVIVTICAVGCGIIILILLILLCYACCCRNKGPRRSEHKKSDGPVTESDCQTEWVPDNLNVVMTETGIMTKRNAYKKAHEPINPDLEKKRLAEEEQKRAEQQAALYYQQQQQLNPYGRPQQIIEMHFNPPRNGVAPRPPIPPPPPPPPPVSIPSTPAIASIAAPPPSVAMPPALLYRPPQYQSAVVAPPMYQYADPHMSTGRPLVYHLSPQY